MDPTARTASVLVLEVGEGAEQVIDEALADHERSVLDDGIVVATFDAVTAAIEASASAMRRSRWLSHSGQPLRAGLAHGEVISAGADISGRAVAEARALCRAARGGQILVTDLVRRLLEDERSLVRTKDVRGPPLDEPLETWELTVATANGSRSPIPLPGPVSVARRGGRLVGRVAELDAIERQWEAVSDGERRAVLVAGEPGIGKTRLGAEIAAEVHARGATVLYGRSEEGIDAPYQPFVEALGGYVEHARTDALAALGPESAVLSTLMPALRPAGQAATGAPSHDPGQGQQYVLFSSVASLLSAASAERPLALIIEDLHWADESTLLLFRHLLSTPASLAILLVGTYRSTDIRGDGNLARAVSEIRRHEAVLHIELPGLVDREVASLIAEVGGGELSAQQELAAESIQRETGGNPLFVTEVVRGLAESPAGEAESGSRLGRPPGSPPIPGSVREAIRGRVARLGAETREALEAAAVIGQEFDPGLVERVAELDPGTVAKGLDLAQEAALISETPGEGALAFRHPLIRRTLYDDQGGAGRGRRHRRAAEALEALLRSTPGAGALELARHWYEALPREEPKAAEWCERAGGAALERLDAPTAARWYRRAIELHERSGGGSPAKRCDLLTGLGTAQRQSGDAAFRETLLEAGRLAGSLDDRTRLVRALLANSRGFVSASGEVDEEKIALLGSALEAVGDDDSAERAQLLALLAAELSFSGEWERRVALSDEAMAIARRVGDRRTLSDVLTARFVTIWMPETLEERLENTAEAVALADELGDPVAQFRAIHWRGVALVQAGEMAEAIGAVDREDRLARRLGDPTALWMATYDRANMAMIGGRLEEAEALANEALEIGTASGQPDALPFYASQLADVRHEQGRLPELQPMIAQVVAENPGIPGFRALLALAYAEGELREEARNVLAIDAATDFSEIPRDVTWLAVHVIYANVCAEIDEEEGAETLYRRLAPWADQVAYTGISALGDVDHALGRLATVLGRNAEAERHLLASAERCRRIGAPVWVARVSLDTARLLLVRNEEGDRERAAALLERAASDARRLGATTIARRAASMREYERASAVIEAALGPARRLELRAPKRRKAGRGDGAGAREGAAPPPGTGRHASLRREGDVWAVGFGGRESRLKHAKGLGYLARLLGRPGVELHVVELQGGSGADPSARGEGQAAARGAAEAGLSVRAAGSGDAGEALDPEAKLAYRLRVDELREKIEEAERFNDPERAARAREELEFVGRELAAAVGLGDRDRRAASEAERARVNVTRAIRKAIARIGELNPALGGHLDACVRTGSFCAYEPRAGDEITWELDPERPG